ncbi:hypothetical protein JCM16303_003655 [Sporobolomyces ruberrimus]
MPKDYSHSNASQPPTPYASTSTARGGEWDSPRTTSSRRRQLAAASTPGSTRQSTTRSSSGRELVRSSDYKPVYSKYKQEILSEEEYISHLSDIIKRDFFPQLHSLDTRREIIQGLESQDEATVEESVRRMRELCTPVAIHGSRRGPRNRVNDTPGRTPFDSIRGGSSTPTAFDRTPLTSFSETPEPSTSRSRSHLPAPSSHINTSLSLDAFQSRYTSEDNSSFATLLARDNELRKEKTRWAWEAEKRANLKQIRGREARERLVDVTREMVERSGDGSVWMLEGGKAGRPGERQVLVARGMGVGENDRGLIVGRDEKERLRITGGGEGRGIQKLILGAEGEEGDLKGKGKGKEVVKIDEKAKQFVDWDRPAVEEEQANRPLEKSQLQVEVETWPFKNRNSLMFPPDADTDPSDPPPLQTSATSGSSSNPNGGPILPMGEPKGIRYHATRLMELEGGGGDGSEGGTPSPSRSRINAAISGTPYPGSNQASSSTPRVNDFSFVSALPTPRAHQLGPQALQELMTWGSIEATPVTIRTNDAAGDSSVGPFRIEDTSKREELAFKMARKAKRSLAESANRGGSGGRKGLAIDSRGTGSLRRGGLDASVRSSATPGGGGGNITPRTGDYLSPAARSLLSKTNSGKLLDRGLRGNQTELTGKEKKEEEVRRIERAKKRAREVESQDRLKRERWTPSPAVSLGFDPDLEEQRFMPKHGRVG